MIKCVFFFFGKDLFSIEAKISSVYGTGGFWRTNKNFVNFCGFGWSAGSIKILGSCTTLEPANFTDTVWDVLGKRKVEDFIDWSKKLSCDYTNAKQFPTLHRNYSPYPDIQQDISIKQMLLFVHDKLQTYSLTRSEGVINSKSTTSWRVDYLTDNMFCGEELVDWFRDDPYSFNFPIFIRNIQIPTKVDVVVQKIV